MAVILKIHYLSQKKKKFEVEKIHAVMTATVIFIHGQNDLMENIVGPHLLHIKTFPSPS